MGRRRGRRGAGGRLAAYAAAVAGRSVLLLEKAELPRYKTCGSSIIGPSRDALHPASNFLSRTGCTRSRSRSTASSPAPGAPGRCCSGSSNRPEFDQQLVEHAQKAGAIAHGSDGLAGRTARLAVPDRRTVAVVLQGGEAVLARAVVGADGSASRIGARVGVKLDQVDLGLEAIPVPETVAEDWQGRVLIDWGPMPGSYGWVFPKGDTLTVGVISARGEGAATKRYLEDFVAQLGWPRLGPSVSSGHLTRCRAEDSPLSRGRVLVCGDAAGLLEPWTREGISFALRSGQLAGEWAVRIAEAHDAVDTRRQALNYAFAIKAGLGVEMAVGKSMLAAFERRPGMLHAAITSFRPAWRAFAGITRGSTTLGELVRSHPMAGRALSALRPALGRRRADGRREHSDHGVTVGRGVVSVAASASVCVSASVSLSVALECRWPTGVSVGFRPVS